MIVKNEQHCIAACLNSVKQYIDYWIISDTGSTDNTKQIILETMSGIPGQLIDNQWIDFATNRNIAIDASKSKADYTLIIDADDKLVVTNSDAFNNLTSDAYKIKIHHGTLEYYRPQLISNKIDYKYCDVLHEYLAIPDFCSCDILHNVYMQTSFSGARSKNPNKFIDDAAVLEKALIDNPSNSRYVFYLAQSYRDAGMLDKALSWYLVRADMGGWHEEVYVSLLEAGKASERLAKPTFDVESIWLKASYVNPARAESLYYLSKYFRLNNNFNKAFCYAKEAIKITKPIDSLFVEENIYKWQILDELSISAYYVGAIEEGKKACQQLINMQLPQIDKDRIINNYKFFSQTRN